MKIILAAILIASSVYATGGGPSKLTFEQLKDSCVNFSRYGYQRAPGNIKIHCSNTERTWQRDVSGINELPVSRKLGGYVTTDKADVTLIRWNLDVEDFQFGCPVYKEIKTEFEMAFNSSCTEINAFHPHGTLKEFCKIKIDAELGENPDIATTTPTGRTARTCKTTIHNS
jgi:hypothetical protein